MPGNGVRIVGIKGDGIFNGCSHANGGFSNVTVSGQTLTLNGVTCDATWQTHDGAGLTLDVALGTDTGHQSEIFTFDYQHRFRFESHSNQAIRQNTCGNVPSIRAITILNEQLLARPDPS